MNICLSEYYMWRETKNKNKIIIFKIYQKIKY